MKHYSGNDIIRAAAKDPGCRIVNGKGDHVKIYKGGEMMPVPCRDIGTGLMHKIIKWCLKMGIALAILITIGKLIIIQLELLGF